VNVNIVFSCVNSYDWEDDTWTDKDGTLCFIIKLPSEKVKAIEINEVRELMLEKAQERLHQAA
jgi:hypothetical protein